ncbi:MAG: DUF3054 domain-containing protein [Anaerolineae bacterium]
MKRTFPFLLLGDLLILLVFVLIGQADHQTLNRSNPLVGALPNFLPLASAWLVMALVLRAYPRAALSLRAFLARSALAWLLAAPLGLFLRMLLLQRGGVPLPFLLVTLSIGGLMLLGWRVLYWVGVLRKQTKPTAAL